MKKRAYALLVVLCLCFASFAAACNDKNGIATTGKLDLDDYAVRISEARKKGLITEGSEGYTEAVKLDWEYESTLSSDLIYVKQADPASSYRYLYGVYNGDIDQTIVPIVYSSRYDISYYNGIIVGSGDEYTVYSCNGNELIVSSSPVSVRTADPDSYYYKNEPITHVISYMENSKYKIAYAYTDDTGYAALAPESEITRAPLHTSGGAVTARKSASFDGITERDPFLDSYEATYERTSSGGYKYYFEKDGKTTTATIPANNVGVYYCGGKLLYATSESVAFDSESGYNYVYSPETLTNTVKTKFVYYSFDIASGKTSELNLGYAIYGDITPLYNKSEKRYDAFAVSAIPFENGVAHYTGSSSLHAYITDASGKVGFDFTEYGNCNPRNIIRLKANRYLLISSQNSYLLDGKGKSVAFLGRNVDCVSESAGVIAVYDSRTNRSGAVDFDGKLVLGYDYYSLYFCGKSALAKVYDKFGNLSESKLVSVAKADGETVEEALKLSSDESWYDAILPQGMIVTQKSDGADSNAFTIYNYDGKTLASFDARSVSNVLTEKSFGGKTLISVRYYTSGYGTVTDYYLFK